MMSKQAEPAGSSDSALGGSPALECVIQVGKLMRQAGACTPGAAHTLPVQAEQGRALLETAEGCPAQSRMTPAPKGGGTRGNPRKAEKVHSVLQWEAGSTGSQATGDAPPPPWGIRPGKRWDSVLLRVAARLQPTAGGHSSPGHAPFRSTSAMNSSSPAPGFSCSSIQRRACCPRNPGAFGDLMANRRPFSQVPTGALVALDVCTAGSAVVTKFTALLSPPPSPTWSHSGFVLLTVPTPPDKCPFSPSLLPSSN